MLGVWNRLNKASNTADNNGVGTAEERTQVILRGRESINRYLRRALIANSQRTERAAHSGRQRHGGLLGERFSQRSFELITYKTEIEIPNVKLPQLVTFAPEISRCALLPVIVVVGLPVAVITDAPLLLRRERDRAPGQRVAGKAYAQLPCAQLEDKYIFLGPQSRRRRKS